MYSVIKSSDREDLSNQETGEKDEASTKVYESANYNWTSAN